MQSENFVRWLRETMRAAAFFATALIVFSALRLFFFEFYRADQPLSAEWPALLLGARLDAKWFTILLLPAWLLWLAGLWRSVFLKVARWFAVAALSVFVLLGLVNFGFYGFYVTPISSLIFGFLQDDTTAIIVTLWRDWPIVTYLVAWLMMTLIPCFVYHACRLDFTIKRSGLISAVVAVILSTLIALMCRGSFGTFPLRQQDLIVGPDPFVNATIQNGTAALVEANKSRKMLELKGGVLAGLKKAGFQSPEEALALLTDLRGQTDTLVPPPLHQPHVVIALMEGMGRTEFEIDSPTNDMLGRLRPELKDAYVFKNGVSSTSGTFPSLESLVFDTPYTPLSQSRYGQKAFPFANTRDFKKAGYTTVFLTSGSEKWRSIDENFPRHGFDRIIGAGQLKAKYPQAEYGTWGVGDEWTFKYANELLTEADQRGEKLLMVILSVTNHPPHHVPDGVKVNLVNTAELPPFIKDDRNDEETRQRLRTYQYAASALGNFIHRLRETGLLKKTAVAATGDHNTRFKFDSPAAWYCQQAVPVMFWLPDGVSTTSYDADRWVGHRDIFPTMKALALGKTPELWQGRNLFADHVPDGIYAFTSMGNDGFAIGRAGAVAVDGANYRCYAVDKNKISQTSAITCTPELNRLGNLARAQRALADYVVRRGVLEN